MKGAGFKLADNAPRNHGESIYYPRNTPRTELRRARGNLERFLPSNVASFRPVVKTAVENCHLIPWFADMHLHAAGQREEGQVRVWSCVVHSRLDSHRLYGYEMHVLFFLSFRRDLFRGLPSLGLLALNLHQTVGVFLLLFFFFFFLNCKKYPGTGVEGGR